MNKLDLTTLGVEEMNEVEMRDVDGGIVILAVNALYVFALYGAFRVGYDDGQAVRRAAQ